MSKVISLSKFRMRNRKSAVPTKYKQYKRTDSVFSYKLVLSLISIISIFIGSFLFSKIQFGLLSDFILKIVASLQNKNLISILKMLAVPEIISMLLSFILGTNLFGNFLITFVPALKLCLVGYFGALMYSRFELNGVLFCLIFLVPYFAATNTLLIEFSDECFKMSKELNQSVLQRKTAKDGTLQLFLIRFIIILLIDLVFVVLNSILISSFGGKIILQ